MEKDIVERLDSMSGLSDRDSDTRNDAVLYINILRQKSAQHRVHWTGRYVALIVINLGISFSARSVGIVPRPAANANRSADRSKNVISR